MEYTAIYVVSWVYGSHMQHLTKMRRIKREEGESVKDMLIREDILDETVYLFEGWPKLEGEE